MGLRLITALRGQAAERVEILPAGGIHHFTAGDVLARTGCDKVHAYVCKQCEDRSVRCRSQVSSYPQHV